MLNRHQKVKQLFLRYNTALSSSAPVEWLFSSGSLILSKKWNRLSDKLFERLLMLKTNKQFRWRWSGITYCLHLKNSCLSSSCMLFMWTITVSCQWFVCPILFAAIIQNFEIGGIASHSLREKYLKYFNTMCSISKYLNTLARVFVPTLELILLLIIFSYNFIIIHCSSQGWLRLRLSTGW